jgi:hypothetical protein
MIEYSTSQKEVKILRSFEGLEAGKTAKHLRIIYKEQTVVGGEVVKEEYKSYLRSYDQWEAHQLGQAIIGMINEDLLTNDVQDYVPPVPDQEQP